MNVGLFLLPMWDIWHPPVGISYVADAVRASGHTVELVDFNLKTYLKQDSSFWDYGFLREVKNVQDTLPTLSNDLKQISAEIEELVVSKKLGVIGFAVFNTNHQATLEVIKIVRERFSDLKIFVGGPDLIVQSWDEEIKSKLIDASITGEGEISVPKLIISFAANIKVPNIPGVSRLINGAVRSNPNIPVDIDKIPIVSFDWCNPVDYDSKKIPIMMTRGCYANCAFCSDNAFSGTYRHRKAEDIFQEIITNSEKFKTNSFQVMDSSIYPQHPEMRKLLDLIIDADIKITWGGNCRISKGLTLELLQKMKLAGCSWLVFGVESGSERVLKKMNKGIKPEWASQNLTDCKTVDIRSGVNLILGFPGESELDFQETLDFISDNRDSIYAVSAGPMAGISPLATQIWDHPGKFGLKLLTDGRLDLSKGGDKWETVDGENTYEIRVARRKRLRTLVTGLGIKFNCITETD